MNLHLLTASLFLACTFAHAEPAPIPKALDAQVNRLVALFKDSEGTLHPGSVMTQTLARGDNGPLTLVVFTVESPYKNALYSQYLAAFTSSGESDDAPYFKLVDVVRIGGDTWREITALTATATWDSDRQLTLIDIPVMENPNDDAAPTAPNQPGVIHLKFDDAQAQELVEVK